MSINLIPEVQKQEILEGEYSFKNKYSFDKKYACAYKYINSFIEITSDAEEICCNIDADFKREEYILLIDDGISITARDEEGIFRALSTLKQLVCMRTVKRQRIHDYPMIKNRGVMLDISRGRIPKPENIIKLLELLRDIKYNHFEIYIDGLVFEFEHFKKYIEGKDVLTIEELKKIKKYCIENFIELVPVQNGFGHMEKWLKIPELEDLAIKRDDGGECDTINPFDDRSVELVDTLYSDLFPYFNSEYVNIGMDEPHSLGMGQTKEACEKEGKDNVYISFLNRIIKLVNEKYNRTPMFFDDIIFEKPECIEKIEGNCVVMDWGYETETPFTARCELLSRLGLKFYTCPGTSTWGSYTGRFDNMIYNIENAVKACIAYNGEGMLLTDWGDGGHPQCIAMSYIPYVFGACCSWNYKSSLYDFSYWKKVDIVKYIEEYLDKFIFKKEGVAKILHRMANYYLLENQNRFNETYIKSDTSAYIKETVPTTGWLKPILSKKETVNIENYMLDLKEELTALGTDTPYFDDIILNCDMVILFARFIRANVLKTGDKISDSKLKADFIELRKRFTEQWTVYSKASGVEIFCKRLDDILSKIEG